jgi:predicted metal-dependent hydrolase
MSTELKLGGRRPSRAREEREHRAELLEQLRRDGARIAQRFGLRYRAIEAESGRVKRRYGSCYSDGVIKIRLAHVKTKRPLKYSSMIATLCHELAHLRHFHHGPSFRDFNEVVLDWARREGIYRPEPLRGRARLRPAPPLETLPRPAPVPAPLAVSLQLRFF